MKALYLLGGTVAGLAMYQLFGCDSCCDSERGALTMGLLGLVCGYLMLPPAAKR